MLCSIAYGLLLVCQRNTKRKARMARFVRELELPTMFLYDRSRKAQSQSDAFAHLLGGKEWLHDLGPELSGNTRSAVNDGEHGRTRVQRHFKTNPSLSRQIHNRIESVLKQVKQHLLDLNITAGNHQSGIDFWQEQIDGVILEALLAYLQGLCHNFGDRGRTYPVLGPLAGELAHASYNASNAVGSVKNAFTVPFGDGQGHATFFLDPAQQVGC